MFDISDRIEPLELSDVFYRLEELLEQDQFELIFPEYKHKHEFQKQQDISLVYLMNDAVESFLVFHNATMTGEYQKVGIKGRFTKNAAVSLPKETPLPF